MYFLYSILWESAYTFIVISKDDLPLLGRPEVSFDFSLSSDDRGMVAARLCVVSGPPGNADADADTRKEFHKAL